MVAGKDILKGTKRDMGGGGGGKGRVECLTNKKSPLGFRTYGRERDSPFISLSLSSNNLRGQKERERAPRRDIWHNFAE